MTHPRPLHLHGPGRAGLSLARMMRDAGWPLCGISGGASRATLPGIPWSPRPEKLPEDALIMIGAPDDALPAAASDLARAGVGEGHLAFHLSGASPIALLEPLRERGAAIGGFHPMHSFASRDATGENLGGALVAVEAEDDESRGALRALAKAAGGEAFDLPPFGRPLYHLAAALMSNGLVALAELAFAAQEAAGVPPGPGREALARLARGTLQNVSAVGPADALTGPVVRGDAGVLTRHLEALRDLRPESHALYVELVRALVRVGSERSDAQRLAAVEKWLEDRSK